MLTGAPLLSELEAFLAQAGFSEIKIELRAKAASSSRRSGHRIGSSRIL